MIKSDKSPHTLRLMEKRNTPKPGKLQFKFDKNVYWKVWLPKGPDMGRKDEVTSIDLELFIRSNEKNRWAEDTLKSTNERQAQAWKETNKRLEWVEYQKIRRVAANVKLPHSRFEGLRYQRKDKTLHCKKSCDRKTKDREFRSRKKFHES